MEEMFLTYFFVFLILAIMPLFINIPLARSRGRSALLFFMITLVFGWIATLILACMEKKKKESKKNGE